MSENWKLKENINEKDYKKAYRIENNKIKIADMKVWNLQNEIETIEKEKYKDINIFNDKYYIKD